MSSNITVNAKKDSVAKIPLEGADAGTIKPGDLLIISCSQTDEWEVSTGGELMETNANGLGNHMTSRGNQTIRTGALVGSLDGGATYFSIGTRLEMVVTAVNSNGTNPNLKLYCWDSDFEDNSGTITAYINTVPDSVFKG